MDRLECLQRVLFVVAACLACGSLLFVTFPPLVDYPQHLAMAAELHETLLGRGGARFVFFSYNGVFELLTAMLAFALPIETAGRLVLAVTLGLQCSGVLRLVRASARPDAYASLWFLGAYSFPFAWGFVNFCFSIGAALHVVAEWRGRRRPALIAVLAMVVAYAHVLGFALMLLAVAIASIAELRPEGLPPTRARVAFVPALAWTVASSVSSDPIQRLSPEAMFVTVPLAQKLKDLPGNVIASLDGPWDERLLVGGTVLALAVLTLGAGRRETTWRSDGVGSALFACAIVYLVAPMCIRGNWYLFHRAAAAGFLLLPAALPVPPRSRWTRGIEAGIVLLGSVGVVNFTSKMLNQPERRDANAIIDAVPNHSRVAPVFLSWASPGASEVPAYVHHVAYAVARRRSETTNMFARRFGTFPIRDHWPPDAMLPEPGFEWSRSFDPDASYAGYFDTVMVRTPDSAPADDPAVRVFGRSVARATRLAHFGRFWLYHFDQ